MRYETTTASQVLRDHPDLCRANFEEAGPGGRLALDEETLRLMEDDSFCVLAKTSQGEAVGYLFIQMTVNILSGSIVATNLTIYVRPDWRGSLLPGRLFVMAEREAKARGATTFFWDCPDGSPLARALERRPYRRKHVIFARDL